MDSGVRKFNIYFRVLRGEKGGIEVILEWISVKNFLV